MKQESLKKLLEELKKRQDVIKAYENLSEKAKKLLEDLPLFNFEIKENDNDVIYELINSKFAWYDAAGGSQFRPTERAKTYVPGELRVIVDNHAVTAELHPGWDDDGEELGEPEYFWQDCNLQELLIAALQLLGAPAEGA